MILRISKDKLVNPSVLVRLLYAVLDRPGELRYVYRGKGRPIFEGI